MRRILIVDDHAVVRAGLKQMFEDQPGETVFGGAATAEQAIKLIREAWDIVVLDISLGGGRNGLDTLKEIKQIRPRLPVLILTMHAEEQYARRAFSSGAAGYITKDSPRAELVSAITRIIGGSKYISPALAEQLISHLDRDAISSPHEILSDREFQVLGLIASGKTVTEIADLLSLSDKTISTYRSRILNKMDMKTNAELTHYAIRNRLVE